MAEVLGELSMMGVPPTEGQGPGRWTQIAADDAEDNVLVVKVRQTFGARILAITVKC